MFAKTGNKISCVEMIFNEYSYMHFENTRSSCSKCPDNILNVKGYSKNRIHATSEQKYNSSETIPVSSATIIYFFLRGGEGILENTQDSNFSKLLQALYT